MLILASQSPRRQELLERAGVPFLIRAANIREERMAGEDPGAYVCRLAREKAESVPRAAGEIILGADTAVVAGGEVLGKPAGPENAAGMLRRLSGCEHEVVTGICLRASHHLIVDKESTRVRFVEMSEEEIAAYVASGEPMDKAGAYAIQGMASKFIDRVEGCYFNVVGLPVALVWRRLKELAAATAPESVKL